LAITRTGGTQGASIGKLHNYGAAQSSGATGDSYTQPRPLGQLTLQTDGLRSNRFQSQTDESNRRNRNSALRCCLGWWHNFKSTLPATIFDQPAVPPTPTPTPPSGILNFNQPANEGGPATVQVSRTGGKRRSIRKLRVSPGRPVTVKQALLTTMAQPKR